MARHYQLVVVGSGTAARTAAMQVRQAGWSVAVIDFRPFGGTCALRGCDPKKVLVGGATAADHAARMAGKGIAGDTRLAWSDLIAFKRTFTDPVPEEQERRYAEAGIDTFHGRALFTGPNTLEVEDTAVEGERILLAAGAEPVRLGIPGEEHLVTNETFLELDHLPRRILLVGGGYIAAEFSHIAVRAGADVTILQHGKRMLEHFDPDLVDWLMEKFRAIGIDVLTGTAVEAVERTDDGYRVSADAGGQKALYDADLVVHAAGRAPALDLLDLEAAGIASERGRVTLNEHLQSVSNPAVYAAGDAAQMGPPLTPVASLDAEVAATNILQGNSRKPDYRGIPSVAFTIPPIAMVGLSEAEARKRGLKVRVRSEKTSGWYSARQAAESTSGFKTIVEEDTGRILGAHLVGPHADEIINIFALAIRNGLTSDQLRETVFAYPTGASDIGYMV